MAKRPESISTPDFIMPGTVEARLGAQQTTDQRASRMWPVGYWTIRALWPITQLGAGQVMSKVGCASCVAFQLVHSQFQYGSDCTPLSQDAGEHVTPFTA